MELKLHSAPQCRSSTADSHFDTLCREQHFCSPFTLLVFQHVEDCIVGLELAISLPAPHMTGNRNLLKFSIAPYQWPQQSIHIWVLLTLTFLSIYLPEHAHRYFTSLRTPRVCSARSHPSASVAARKPPPLMHTAKGSLSVSSAGIANSGSSDSGKHSVPSGFDGQTLTNAVYERSEPLILALLLDLDASDLFWLLTKAVTSTEHGFWSTNRDEEPQPILDST